MTDTKLVHELLSDMIRVRRMEEKCAELYSAAKIRGFLHLYVGEEAVAAGSLRALADDDAVVATYREHAHALLRGIPMTSIISEMFGKQEGCSRGRGGSTRPNGSTGVTPSLPVACHSRWASRWPTPCCSRSG
jgi:pyruvate dehydrogenase E1 component alpha subunit